MIFVLGYLPDDIEEKDIKALFCQFAKVTDVFFFKKGARCHSEYECTVTLNISSYIVGFCIQNKIHNYCWRGRRIHSRMLIF